MNAVEIHSYARKLYEAQGTKALADAAHMVRQFEQRGNEKSLEDWRRIQSALQELRGPNAS